MDPSFGGVPPPPRYMMLDNNGSVRPQPYRRNVPRYDPGGRCGGCSCGRCLCFCCCSIFFLIFLLIASVALFCYAIDPKPPKFDVDDFVVNAFKPQADFSLYAEFAVSVRAQNPNDHLEFSYGGDNSVAVLYEDQSLCAGKLPAFRQGRKNTRQLRVLLKGESPFGSGMQEALSESRNSGRIPLVVAVKVPVTVDVGGLQTRKIYIFVNCSLVVSSISPNEKTKILSSKFDNFRVEL